jgi:hypothetical protein
MSGMGDNPIEQANPATIAWYEKKYGFLNGGGVTMNPTTIKQDPALADALGLSGQFPVLTTSGSALREGSGGIIEMVVHDDPTMVRTDLTPTDPMYWAGHATHYRQYYSLQEYLDLFPDTASHPHAADIVNQYENTQNLSGDRMYKIDSGFGWYLHRGQTIRFFNDVQQSMILRLKWSYEFATPPSRMIRQHWNNSDPNSPLLNSAIPIRYAYALDSEPTPPNGSATVWAERFAGTIRTGGKSVVEALGDGPGSPVAICSDETKGKLVSEIVKRRDHLRKTSYYIFSAFRGREWEMEMAKRMPGGTRLICVEWEDREVVREQFAKLGLKVEFAENRRYAETNRQKEDRTGAMQAGARGADSLTEEQIYSEIARTYFGIDPMPAVKSLDTISEFRTDRTNQMAQMKEVILDDTKKNREKTGSTTPVYSQSARDTMRYGMSQVLSAMSDGKPSVRLSRKNDTVTYGRVVNGELTTYEYERVWPTGSRLTQLLFPNDSTDETPVPLKADLNSISVDEDNIEFRHPMLLYYNDQTSAIYVHYGIYCNPKDIFSRWSDHTIAPTTVVDGESLRRKEFEQTYASNTCALENIYAKLNPTGAASWDQFRRMAPVRTVTDPGSEPIPPTEPAYTGPAMPIAPAEPPVPVEPSCALPWAGDAAYAGMTVDQAEAIYLDGFSVTGIHSTKYPGLAWMDSISTTSGSRIPVTSTGMAPPLAWVDANGNFYESATVIAGSNYAAKRVVRRREITRPPRNWGWVSYYYYDQFHPLPHLISNQEAWIFGPYTRGVRTTVESTAARQRFSMIPANAFPILDQDTAPIPAFGIMNRVFGDQQRVSITFTLARQMNIECVSFAYDEAHVYLDGPAGRIFFHNSRATVREDRGRSGRSGPIDTTVVSTLPAGAYTFTGAMDDDQTTERSLRGLWVRPQGLDPTCLAEWRLYEQAMSQRQYYFEVLLPAYQDDWVTYQRQVGIFQDAHAQWVRDNSTYAQRLITWQQKKSAYDTYVASNQQYLALKADADAYLTMRSFWVGQVQGEGTLPGVEWAGEGGQTVSTAISNPEQMPETPIFQGYKYIIDPSYPGDMPGAKDLTGLTNCN